MNVISSSDIARLMRTASSCGLILALAIIISVGGCKRKYQTVVESVPPTPEEIKEMVGHLKVKKKVGFIADIRIPAANRLAEVGPAAKDSGAVPLLEKMALDKDPEAKAAAEKALQKIKGQ